MTRSKKLLAASLIGGLVGAMLVAPRAARAIKQWEDDRRAAWIADATAALERGEETLPAIPWGMNFDEDSGIEMDDASVRRLVNLQVFGNRTPAAQAEIQRIAGEERAKMSRAKADGLARQLGGGDAQANAPVGTPAQWSNLGPAGARSQWNGSFYNAQDTGRPTAIRVDPTNNNVVYNATSGGGVWKTSNFNTQLPTWVALTETLGSLAIGAMDIDPQNHNTVYIGTGDAFDQKAGQIFKSIDGGTTWSAAVSLPLTVGGSTITSGGVPVIATNVRGIAVDPTNGQVVFATSDVGLFRSTDGGASFVSVDLPNTAPYSPPGSLSIESTWDVVYLGQAGNISQWMLSGVYACPNTLPGQAGFGVSTVCALAPGTAGNIGDIWKSIDGGSTWSSMRVAGKLPTQQVGWPTALGDVGRIALGAGGTTDPTTTAVYAEAGNAAEGASKTIVLFNTRDAGNTWNNLGTPLDPVFPAVNARLTNPTFGADCKTLDLGHAQSWYNLAVAVDPGDSNRALMGGNLCSVRTLDGGLTWQNSSHWLPSGGGGATADGAGDLQYVHADWHTATMTRLGGKLMVLAGTDGGVFVTYDLFDLSPTQIANWIFPDYGLITHLGYAHGTGDPSLGNAQVLYAGFQDNGTRWRLSESELIVISTALNWDQVTGGDGTGDGVASDTNGQNQTYWSSVQQRRQFCRPTNLGHDCGVPVRVLEGHDVPNWVAARIPTAQVAAGDSEPFVERFSPTYDAAASVISATTFNLWKITADANDKFVYTRLSPTGFVAAGVTRNTQGQAVFASPVPYNIGGVTTRVYGAVLTGGHFGVLADVGGTITQFNTLLGMRNAGQTEAITGSSTVAFPRDPTHWGGTDPRKTLIGGSVATLSTNLTNGNVHAIPATFGHIFLTNNQGASWTPIHGNGTGFDLPNVPIYVIRFDYSDATDQTLYVGTELGLYRTTDGGNTWIRYGGNLPLVRVTDISVSLNGSLVRVTTYGRGIWEIYPRSELSASNGLGDWDKNGVIDFLDLAATAARMGSTPLGLPAPPAPNYDSAVDVAGTPGTIDEADLTALLAKFGSTP